MIFSCMQVFFLFCFLENFGFCDAYVGAIRLKELSVHLSDTERQFDSVVSYFCVKAPHGERHVTPTHFFGLWSPFLREFQRLWSIEMKNRAMAR